MADPASPRGRLAGPPCPRGSDRTAAASWWAAQAERYSLGVRRFVPFLLLGILTVGAAIGLGFGLAAEPAPHATGLGPVPHVVSAGPASSA